MILLSTCIAPCTVSQSCSRSWRQFASQTKPACIPQVPIALVGVAGAALGPNGRVYCLHGDNMGLGVSELRPTRHGTCRADVAAAWAHPRRVTSTSWQGLRVRAPVHAPAWTLSPDQQPMPLAFGLMDLPGGLTACCTFMRSSHSDGGAPAVRLLGLLSQLTAAASGALLLQQQRQQQQQQQQAEMQHLLRRQRRLPGSSVQAATCVTPAAAAAAPPPPPPPPMPATTRAAVACPTAAAAAARPTGCCSSPCMLSLFDSLAGIMHRRGPGTASAAASGQHDVLCLAGTHTGQVWAHSPEAALGGAPQVDSAGGCGTAALHAAIDSSTAALAGASSSSSSGSGHAAGTLLLDLQQPVLAVLPLCKPTDAAAAVLVVGRHGRLVMLHMEQQQQQQQDTPSLVVATQQLPYCLDGAHVIAQPSAPLLLLVQTRGGCLLVAELPPRLCAATDASSSSGVQQRSDLRLRLHQVPLPARVARTWPLCTTAAAAPSAPDGGGGSGSGSAVVAQLCGDGRLVLLPGAALQSQARQAHHAVAAASASSLRHELSCLMDALGRLVPATAALDGALMRQRSGLAAAQRDLQLLESSTALAVQVPAAAATAAAAAAAAQQQQQQQLKDKAQQGGPQQHQLLPAPTHTPALPCRVRLEGLWSLPPVAAANFSRSSVSSSSSSRLHLAVRAELPRPAPRTTTSTTIPALPGDAEGGGRLTKGWQLLACLLPESGAVAACQVSVPVPPSSGSWRLHAAVDGSSNGSGGCSGGTRSSSSGSSGGGGERGCVSDAVSMLLPLPAACAALLQGCWLRLYAVRAPPTAPCCGNNSCSSSSGVTAPPGLPALALLAEVHVSAHALAALAQDDRAAAAAARAALYALVPAARQRSSIAADSKPTAAGPVGAVFRLRAAVTHLSGAAPSLDPLLHPKAKRRARAATTTQPPQPLTAQQSLLRPAEQQSLLRPAEQQNSSCAGTPLPLGSKLSAWLVHVLGSGRTAFSNALLAPGAAVLNLPGGPPVALLQCGTTAVRLAGGTTAHATWTARPQATAGDASGSSSSSCNQPAGAELPVSLALRGSSAPALAQLHRVVALSLEAALADSAHAGRPGPWAVSAAAQQLRCALRSTRKLHMQLLHMQDEAELLMRMRTQLSTALVSSAGRGGAVAAGMQNDDDGVDGAGAQMPQGSTADDSAQLHAGVQRWLSGLQGAYGALLLAASEAAVPVCCEV